MRLSITLTVDAPDTHAVRELLAGIDSTDPAESHAAKQVFSLALRAWKIEDVTKIATVAQPFQPVAVFYDAKAAEGL